MKVNAGTLRVGNVIEHNGRLFSVLTTSISQPGKGGSFINVDLRDIENGNKDTTRFRTQESVERARLDQEKFQYLYNDGDAYHFMQTETYNQITLPSDMIGDKAPYLTEGLIVEVESFEGKPLSMTLPDTLTFEITEADPVVKGQTASSSYKPAVLENGLNILVPPHITAGTRVVVKTEDGSYVEKAKD